MNKTKSLQQSCLSTTLLVSMISILHPLPAAAQIDSSIWNAKNGFYGGVGLGTINVNISRQDVFDDYIVGTDVDFSQVHISVESYIKNNDILPTKSSCSPNFSPCVDNITIDNSNKSGTKSELTSYYNNLGSETNTIALLDNPNNRTFVIRLFGGYNFKSFFGVEFGGFVTIGDITTDIPSTTFSFDNETPGNGQKVLMSADVSFESNSNLIGLEAMGKVHLPLNPLFAHAKGGVAWVADINESTLKINGKVRSAGSTSTTDEPVEIYNETVSNTSYEIRPVVGAGVALRLGTRTVIDVSALHYEQTGKQPTMDMVMLNITFEFTDKMCGDLYC